MTTSTDGITLLGAEMLTWSDAGGEAGAFGGLLAPQLLHGFGAARGRALVAGPTSTAVILDVAAHVAGVDVLVRSWLDAQQLRAELPAEIGVFCGPVDRMVRTGAVYDTVIAVAGLDRLHSAEEETPLTAAVLADLAALVSAEGELFAGVGNEAGVDQLLSLGVSARHQDADWPAGHLVPSSVLTAGEVAAELAERHGLVPVETWVCHGRRSDPLVAAPAATLTTHARDSVLLREVGRAYDVADPSAPALKDPAETVRDLVRAGLGAATAPLAILHLRRGVAAAETPDVVLVQEPRHDGSPAVAYRLTPTGSGWERALLGEPATLAVAAGLIRDTAALNSAVPDGETLAVAVEACIAAHDVSAAGALIRRYRDWLGAAGTEVAADRVPVLPRMLVVSGPELVLLDSGWRASGTASRDVVLARGLLDLAAGLLARGVRHPWSPAASARRLAASLAAAAGIEDASALLDAAIDLDGRLRPVGTAPDYDSPGNAGRLSHAELAELADGLAARAAEADQHIVWLLKRLQGRQRALRKVRGQVRALETSREMWIGRRVFVIRSLVRRRRRRIEAASEPTMGEWRDRTGQEQDEAEARKVEANLLPPGYTPGPDIDVVPPEDD
jgi:hypothetical protein